MKKLYTNPNPIFVQHIKALLESHGISCVLRNESLQGGVGSLPPLEVWPEIWVADEESFEKGTQILNESLSDKESSEDPWQCEDCSEIVESQFTDCWQCGRSR